MAVKITNRVKTWLYGFRTSCWIRRDKEKQTQLANWLEQVNKRADAAANMMFDTVDTEKIICV